MKHRLWKSIVPWVAAFVLVACGAPPTDDAGPGSPATGTQAMTCEEAFAAAADAANVQDTPEALDATLQACATIDAWTQTAQSYPNVLQGVNPETFLVERCAELGPDVSNLCAQVRQQFPERFP